MPCIYASYIHLEYPHSFGSFVSVWGSTMDDTPIVVVTVVVTVMQNIYRGSIGCVIMVIPSSRSWSGLVSRGYYPTHSIIGWYWV